MKTILVTLATSALVVTGANAEKNSRPYLSWCSVYEEDRRKTSTVQVVQDFWLVEYTVFGRKTSQRYDFIRNGEPYDKECLDKAKDYAINVGESYLEHKHKFSPYWPSEQE